MVRVPSSPFESGRNQRPGTREALLGVQRGAVAEGADAQLFGEREAGPIVDGQEDARPPGRQAAATGGGDESKQWQDRSKADIHAIFIGWRRAGLEHSHASKAPMSV